MRRSYAAWLAVCGLLLSACGGLSTSSPVHQGLDVSTVQENQVRVLVNPVGPGSSPEEVVTGFVRAAAASDDQYQVARSYLVPVQEATWRPDSSVMVFTDDASLTITRSGSSSVKAVAQVSGRIDGDGRYHELPPGSKVSVSFGLQRIGGEWRISKLPQGFGTWLSEADVSRLYDPFRIYYISATERRLVPDVRWFPVGTGLATRLARTLLAGIPDYLSGAVRSDIPAGTRLAVDSVPIESGTAQVDLTATRVSSDPAQRQGLAAQLLATVMQASGVERVALQLDGTDLQVPGAASTGLFDLSALGFPTPADAVTKPLLRKGTSLVAVDPQQLGEPGNRPPAQPSGSLPSIPLGWAYLAMAPSGGEVAAVSGDRTQLERWRGLNALPVVTVGSELTRPVYDAAGVLWLAGVQGGASRLWAVNPSADPKTVQGRPQLVSAGWLEGRSVVSLRFAPDGQRVALISTDRNGRAPRIDVAGVVRQPNGIPQSLSTPITLAPSLTTARDLVWVDDATLAVLGRKVASQAVRPWFVPLGGPITAGPEIPGAMTITTVNAERGL
ncbi:LpqB family beta-propeller domain-containing protein, partial [Pedococcus sp.]|uniref:LpqB family beta-propeller domain-containing protein n=1 Tax=Pedococcus sp. TaxID=2860345 RepID=UPI002E110B25|nr:LpqB family beta-propeller domain-containing protein [Pedococcus sp.]